MKEHHYSPLHTHLMMKQEFDYGTETKLVPLNEKEMAVLPFLRGVTFTNCDEDTYDACFKSILAELEKKS